MKHDKTVSEYLRDDVVEPFLQAKAKEATGAQFTAATGAQFTAATGAQFIRDVKEYLDLATGISIAGGSGLPSGQ
jgi:hypothetical protein